MCVGAGGRVRDSDINEILTPYNVLESTNSCVVLFSLAVN